MWDQIQDLKSETEEIDYDVNLDFTYEEIEELVGSEGGGAVGMFLREQEGLIERFIPEIQVPDFDLKIDLPNLDELITQRRFIWWVTSPAIPRSSTRGQEIRIERS